MDTETERAYRILLAQGLLHVKWDLNDFSDGLFLTRPWKLIQQSRRVRMAAHRAVLFHNLAIFSTADFEGFSQERFWADVDYFQRAYPNALCPYRNVFERCLRGEPICIIAPDGIGSTAERIE